MQITEIQCKIFEKIFAQMEKSSEKSTEMSDRITKIRAKLCRGKNKIFAEKINKSTQYASALCLGKSNPGKGMLEEILTAFPMVSRAWLYFGEGEMLVDNSGQYNQQSNMTVEGDNIVNGSSKTTTEGMDTLIATNARLAATLQQQADQIDRLLNIIESKL